MQAIRIDKLNYDILIIGPLFFVFGFVTWLGGKNNSI
jgi:hypothetical protein